MKKTLAIILGVLMVAGCFTACGESSINDTSKPAETAAEPAKEEQKEAWKPEGSIDFVCPYSAGGGSDILARTIANIMTEKGFTDAAVIVNNQSGGGGTVGDAYTKSKAGDNNTLSTFATGQVAAQIANKTTTLWSDFTPICLLATEEMTLAVSSDCDYSTFEELVAYSKAHPGEVTVGGSGIGTDDNIVVGLVNLYAEAGITYVPYDSTGEVMTAILGGHVTSGVFNPSEISAQLEAGKVKVICSMGADRLDIKGFEDVPTCQELGYKEIDFVMFRAITGAPDMSAEAQEYWVNVFEQVSEATEWKDDYLLAKGLTPNFLTGDELVNFLKGQHDTMQKILEQIGLA